MNTDTEKLREVKPERPSGAIINEPIDPRHVTLYGPDGKVVDFVALRKGKKVATAVVDDTGERHVHMSRMLLPPGYAAREQLVTEMAKAEMDTSGVPALLNRKYRRELARQLARAGRKGKS